MLRKSRAAGAVALLLLFCVVCISCSGRSIFSPGGKKAAFHEEGRTPSKGALYFNDAVFIGDSITVSLSSYAVQMRKDGKNCLQGAQFITSGGLGFVNAQEEISDDSRHPLYKGEKIKIEDAVKSSGAKKVYIMLGMNDLALYTDAQIIDAAQKLVSRIRNNVSDAQLFFQSVTPILKGNEQQNLTNRRIAVFNQALEEYCKEKGFKYIDIALPLRDGDGSLKPEYCSGTAAGKHLTPQACSVWVDRLQSGA